MVPSSQMRPPQRLQLARNIEGPNTNKIASKTAFQPLLTQRAWNRPSSYIVQLRSRLALRRHCEPDWKEHDKITVFRFHAHCLKTVEDRLRPLARVER